MNKFDERLIEWSEKEFNVKNCPKESLNLLRAKNGTTFKKILSFMTQTIKSKENGETIQRFCDSIQLKEDLKSTADEIRVIESDISRVRNQLIVEELNRKKREIKEELNANKVFVSTLLLDVMERISAKNKHCTQLKPNLKTIDDIIDCYERLYTPIDDFDLDKCLVSDQMVNNSKNCDHLLDQINQLMESIESIVYDLNDIKAIKPINISYDLDVVSKGLTQTEPNIEFMSQNKNEKEAKNTAIATKLVSVHNLMQKYEKIRSEKLAKNKDKMQKVINSCDAFIQQNA
ncbi:unnamed protein product [Medioppia subpectinata]|uniref:Uncharacterized protein n=1 Tax=Medioppia subpectinata TaxID=1979941 RepID=A0A7R9L597_9ACAR|nr:unnamed protein product [Medioppia subpectinata]CAG2114723.1 unnamed protein product [Medioppia subpectinata]